MDTERIKRRIGELDRIAATTPHADTRHDAQMQASALREKLPEGERDFTEPPRPQGGINRNHGMGNFWTYRPPSSPFNWKIFEEAIRAFEDNPRNTIYESHAQPRRPKHPIHTDTIHRMSEEDIDQFTADYPEYFRRPQPARTKEEIMREYLAEKAGSFGKVKP